MNPPAARVWRTLTVPAHVLQELNELLRTRGILLPVCSPQRARNISAKGRDDDSRRFVSTRIGRVVELIDDELDEGLSLDRLADEARLSKYHFSRVFREEIGETPWAYVRRARVRKAKELLKRGASPAAAAIEAGFFDQSHLTRALRELEGTTPGQFQKEHALRREADDPPGFDRKNVQE